MKKRLERSATSTSHSNKTKTHNLARGSRRLLKSLFDKHCQPHSRSQDNWYHQKKQAQKRLSSLSKGNIHLVSGIHFGQIYYGDHIRHWLRDERCEHIFKATMREVATVGSDNICPFCNVPIEMIHYGSFDAVAEHVNNLSFGNVLFLEHNTLGKIEDTYQMFCLIHDFRFEIAFDKFLADPTDACPICLLKFP